MSDHLPECTTIFRHDFGVCICARLRAAEQRVLDGFLSSMTMNVIKSQEFFHGVAQARDAVAAALVPSDSDYGSIAQGLDVALAAIDALKGQS